MARRLPGAATWWRMRVLNHIALTVRDPERSSRFYRHLLGLEGAIHQAAYGIVMLTSNGLILAFLNAQSPRPCGGFHIGLSMPTPGDVRTLRAQLHAARVQEVEWSDEPGFVSLKVLDPDGYLVEAFWEAELLSASP